MKVVQNYQVGIPLNTHKSVKWSIQTTFDGKIRIYVEIFVGIDWLVLEKNMILTDFTVLCVWGQEINQNARTIFY